MVFNKYNKSYDKLFTWDQRTLQYIEEAIPYGLT